MDENQSPSQCEDMEVKRSFTLLEITLISCNEVTIKCRYADISFCSGMAPPTKCPGSNAEYDPKLNPESPRYNAGTAPAVRDLSSAEQYALKWGITVLESQRPQTRTITVPEVQEQSTVKRIPTMEGWQRPVHKEKKQQLYSENREKCTQGCDDKWTYRWIKKSHAHVTNPNEILTQSWQSQFSLDNPAIHSCYRKLTIQLILPNQHGTQRSHNG